MADISTLKKPRVYLWDNVKSLLIFLVVLGHFVTQCNGKFEVAQQLFTIIYSFHMPLFIFVSGMFAKSSFKDGVLKVNKVISYLILYLALKTIIFLEGLAFGKHASFRLFYEGGIPWYMFAMAVFICATYVLRDINPRFLIPFSFVLALIAGYESGIGDTFALSRLLVFYPVFLLGFYTDSVSLAEFSRKPALRLLGGCLLFIFIVVTFFFDNPLYFLRTMMTARHSYAKLGIPELGALYRMATYVLGAAVSFAVICVLPNKKNALSYIGAATLPIYFLHRPILYVFMDCGLGAKLINGFGGYGIYIFFALSVVLTLLLSWPALSKPFNKLMSFSYSKLFKVKK